MNYKIKTVNPYIGRVDYPTIDKTSNAPDGSRVFPTFKLAQQAIIDDLNSQIDRLRFHKQEIRAMTASSITD